MKLKDRFRKWLEITDLELELDRTKRKIFDSTLIDIKDFDNIKPLIVEVLEELAKKDNAYNIYGYSKKDTHKAFEALILSLSKRSIDNYLNSEEFIDKIIDRIKKKQL